MSHARAAVHNDMEKSLAQFRPESIQDRRSMTVPLNEFASDLAPELVPGFDMLRRAETSAKTVETLDLIPQHLHARLLAHMAGRSQFSDDCIRTVFRSVGFDELAEVVGSPRAFAIGRRYNV